MWSRYTIFSFPMVLPFLTLPVLGNLHAFLSAIFFKNKYHWQAVFILTQTICKCYHQTTLVGKEFKGI